MPLTAEQIEANKRRFVEQRDAYNKERDAYIYQRRVLVHRDGQWSTWEHRL